MIGKVIAAATRAAVMPPQTREKTAAAMSGEAGINAPVDGCPISTATSKPQATKPTGIT